MGGITGVRRKMLCCIPYKAQKHHDARTPVVSWDNVGWALLVLWHRHQSAWLLQDKVYKLVLRFGALAV